MAFCSFSSLVGEMCGPSPENPNVVRLLDLKNCARDVKAHLKWYCDENHIFPIEPILKHKQVACMTRKMLFTIFKYLFSFQRYLSF